MDGREIRKFRNHLRLATSLEDAHEEGKRPMVGMEEKLESLEIIYDLQPAG